MDAILHAVRSTIISSTGRRRRLALLTCLLPLVLLTSGCAHLANWKHNGFKVGPNYCQPAAPYADEYLDAYDQRISADLHGHEEWWTVFNDPDMSRLVYTSYEQNLPLRVAGMRVMEARAQRGIAVGSFFPQAQTISGEYSRTQLSKLTFPGNLPGAARAGSLWNTSFDASWEIDLWGKFRRNIESADANYDASIEDYDAILVCLLTDTASTYVGYRTFQERLRYARKNVEIQEGSLSIAQTRFDNGATSELDVTQAKTILQNTRELIPLFENQLRISNNLLCVLLGIPPADLAGELGNEPIPVTPSTVAVGVPADLLRRRPDVRKAEREVAAQSARIGVATADLFPHFSIFGSIGYAAPRMDRLFTSAAATGTIAPGFTWDFLNYGRLVNNINVQDARFQQLALAYQQTVLEANAESDSAINTFLQSQQRLVEIQAAVAAAERSVELAITQYRQGATDYNRVFTLQDILVTQQDRLATTQGDVANSLIAIYKALGGGWQIRDGYGAGADYGPQLEHIPPVDADADPAPIPNPQAEWLELPEPPEIVHAG